MSKCLTFSIALLTIAQKAYHRNVSFLYQRNEQGIKYLNYHEVHDCFLFKVK